MLCCTKELNDVERVPMPTKALNVWSATITGRRRYQEDRILVNEKSKLYAIFDGHGGAEASQYASENFQSRYENHFVNTRNQADALRLAIGDIESEFMEIASKQGPIAGTTAVAAVLGENNKVTVAYVGDSPALVCSRDEAGEEKPIKLTTDHHPGVPEERRRIEADGGFVTHHGRCYRVNGKLAVSRAIGDMRFKPYGVVATPDITETTVETGKSQFLVLTSDGIFEKMSPFQACKVAIEAYEKGKDAADALVQQAFETGSTDNLSAIVVKL